MVVVVDGSGKLFQGYYVPQLLLNTRRVRSIAVKKQTIVAVALLFFASSFLNGQKNPRLPG